MQLRISVEKSNESLELVLIHKLHKNEAFVQPDEQYVDSVKTGSRNDFINDTI